MARPNVENDEQLNHLFEPLTIMPAQYFTALRRRAARHGEKRLMIAILEDAVAVYLGHREPTTSKRRRLFRDTERWLRSRDKTWIFSFERICEMLDLDPAWIRRGLRRRREAITGMPSPLVPVHLPPSPRRGMAAMSARRPVADEAERRAAVG